MRSTLGWLAVACMVLGPGLAFLRLLPALAGFAVFALGGLAALVLAIIAVVQGARGHGVGSGGAAAIAAAALFMILAGRGAGVPAINDFTTDLADPPAFHHAQTLAPNLGRDLAYPPAFAAIQRGCCADLRPAHLAGSPADAFARVERVAAGMPSWTVTQRDPASGTLEAVATSRVFGFQDDIVVRVRPDGNSASRVDVRSKSRDGRGDMGVNAARIRDFVRALER
jgi:uncharacterized protein (DUF1499 family)